MSRYRDNYAQFNANAAQVFGVSVDSTWANLAFRDQMKLDFPLLSDTSKETAKAYGVLMPQGFSNRWTFYIDKSGKIAHIDKDVAKRLETSADDMAAKLTELKVPMNHN